MAFQPPGSHDLDPAQDAAPAGGARSMRFGERAEASASLRSLAERYEVVVKRPDTLVRVDAGLTRHAGRPTPLCHAERLSRHTGGARIYLKNEILAPANAHLQIVVYGQVLLAQMMGYQRLITATHGGQRGLLAASMAARTGLQLTVYVDQLQTERQKSRIQHMRLMGAEVKPVEARLLRRGDIREAAMEDWLEHPDENFLVLGLDGGPPPYPRIIRDLVSVIGRETRRQVQGMTGCSATALVARGDGTADALGFFPPFLNDSETRLVCVDPLPEVPPLTSDAGQYDPFSIQLSQRQEQLARRIMEGLEYPAVSREHRVLNAYERIEHVSIELAAAEASLVDMARLEGIVTPVESASTIAWARELAKTLEPRQVIVVNMAQRTGEALLDSAHFGRLVSKSVQ